MTAHLTRPFADGTYPFRIAGKELRELQRICDCGPLELYRRLLSGNWRADDVTETIRLGLLGAARTGHKADVRDQPLEVTPPIALRLVREYVDTFGAPFIDPDGESGPSAGDPLPWTYSALLAAQILEGALAGSKDEPLGKKTTGAGETSDRPSRTASSDGLQSSPPSLTEE